MPLVVNFGNAVTATYVLSEKGKYYPVFSERIVIDMYEDFLRYRDSFHEVINKIYTKRPYLKKEALIVSVDYGAGIEFRTVQVAKDTLFDFDTRSKERDIEEHILEISNSYLPLGLDGLYEKYESTIMSSFEGETDMTLSIAYIPSIFLDNIKKYCEEEELILSGIKPYIYGLVNSFKHRDRQAVLDAGATFVCFNDSGVMVWPKVKGGAVELSDVYEFLRIESERMYSIDSDSAYTDVVDLANPGLFRDEVYAETVTDGLKASAVGCVLIDRLGGIVTRKGKKQDVTGKLRELFKKK